VQTWAALSLLVLQWDTMHQQWAVGYAPPVPGIALASIGIGISSCFWFYCICYCIIGLRKKD